MNEAHGHTPGDWFLAPDGTIRSKVWGKSDMMGDYRGNIVCDLKPAIGSRVWPNTGRKHCMPEAEANGRLLAAAPDMFKALTTVSDHIDYDYLLTPTEEKLYPDFHVEIILSVAEARAVLTALAKAKGE